MLGRKTRPEQTTATETRPDPEEPPAHSTATETRPDPEEPPAHSTATEEDIENLHARKLQAYAQLKQQTKTNEALEKQTDAALKTLKANFFINTCTRALFYLIAVALLAIVGGALYASFDDFIRLMLQAVHEAPFDRSLSRIGETLLALSIPIIYAVVVAAICVGLALLIQNRSIKEFARSLEQVSRLRREASDSRTRALTQILEETLVNARQAFTLQLWISRALFLVGIGLLIAFFTSLVFENGVLTGSSGLGSVAAFAAAALFNPQKQIGSDLANVTQLEAILGGYTRQASVLEEHLYQVMDYHRFSGYPDHANKIVESGIKQLSDILATAVNTIQDKVEAKDQINGREKWLLDQLVDRGIDQTVTSNGQVRKQGSNPTT